VKSLRDQVRAATSCAVIASAAGPQGHPLPGGAAAGERAADAAATAVVAVFGDQPAGELGHLCELGGETHPAARVLSFLVHAAVNSVLQGISHSQQSGSQEYVETHKNAMVAAGTHGIT
jgi:hypothetical protein